MNILIPDFKSQTLILSNELWTVEIYGGNRFLFDKYEEKVTKTISLADNGEWSGALLIKTIGTNGKINKCLIDGIDGGFYLYAKSEKDPSQSVQLEENKLYLSLGFTFLSFDLIELDVLWGLRPDTAEVFEFYNLENDFLLRGELEIHKITKEGKIKWSFAGQDIWVNMQGKREVQIESNLIRLIDFNDDMYVIDLNGKLIE